MKTEVSKMLTGTGCEPKRDLFTTLDGREIRFPRELPIRFGAPPDNDGDVFVHPDEGGSYTAYRIPIEKPEPPPLRNVRDHNLGGVLVGLVGGLLVFLALAVLWGPSP